MKNIHVLPTDKPSRLFLKENNLLLNNQYTLQEVFPKGKCQNIYITSDEEIKNKDYYWDENKQKVKRYFESRESFPSLIHRFKIILTTDKDLIKDGVQAIDDNFLEWFVKNPSCEKVKVEPDYYELIGDCYKIIIPKEEPKLIKCYCGHTTYCDCVPEEPKQEILEKEAEKYENKDQHQRSKLDFIEGAKWQQEQDTKKFSSEMLNALVKDIKGQQERMYSEEEVLLLLQQYRIDLSSGKTPNLGDTTNTWFEQFKKK